MWLNCYYKVPLSVISGFKLTLEKMLQYLEAALEPLHGTPSVSLNMIYRTFFVYFSNLHFRSMSGRFCQSHKFKVILTK
jgi:hypothetical protein